jgi:hypothetical protein
MTGQDRFRWGCVLALLLGGSAPGLSEGVQTNSACLLCSNAVLSSPSSSVWKRNFSSFKAYNESVEPNRLWLREKIGCVDKRLEGPVLQGMTNPATGPVRTELFSIEPVRWPVFEGVYGEGLLLRPKGRAVARVVVLPDADQIPELICGLASGLEPERQYARRLAENGCEVLVMALIDRQTNGAPVVGDGPSLALSHRERISRQAIGAGRHIIGLEAAKALAAVDCLQQETILARGSKSADPLHEPRIGLAGWGEGGVVAFYSAAIDTRISAALISGMFGEHSMGAGAPSYRQLPGAMPAFGDAEVASLIAPRELIVEFSPAPVLEKCAAASEEGGKADIDYSEVERELDRARSLVTRGEGFDHFTLISGAEGMLTGPGSDRSLAAFLNGLNVPIEEVSQPGPAPVATGALEDAAQRQQRQAGQLEAFLIARGAK